MEMGTAPMSPLLLLVVVVPHVVLVLQALRLLPVLLPGG